MSGQRTSREEAWCKDVLLPILQSLSSTFSVRFNGGQSEHGKDFTFNHIDSFGHEVNCALQAKFGDITGRFRKLADLKAQIEEAFDVPYEHKPGDVKRVNLLYVVCSGKFTQEARSSLRENLGKYKQNVFFADGVDIEHWKRLLQAESQHSLQHTVKILSRALVEIDINRFEIQAMGAGHLMSLSTVVVDKIVELPLITDKTATEAMIVSNALKMANMRLISSTIIGPRALAKDIDHMKETLIPLLDSLQSSVKEELTKLQS